MKRKMFLVETETGEPVALFAASHSAMKYGEWINRRAWAGVVRLKHKYCEVEITMVQPIERRTARGK